MRMRCIKDAPFSLLKRYGMISFNNTTDYISYGIESELNPQVKQIVKYYSTNHILVYIYFILKITIS